MIKLQESTLGFSNTKTPMQKARTENTLNKLWRFNEGIMTEKDFVINRLLDGYTVEKEEGYQEYKRNGELTKPKTAYKLLKEGVSTFNLITKTAYDFAVYVIDNNLLDENKIIKYIENEKAEKERLEKERLERERKEREEQEKIRQQEKTERERQRQEKIKIWEKRGNELLTDEQKQEIKNIAYNTIRKFNNTVSDDEIFKYIDLQNYIVKIGNEKYTVDQVNYLFFDLEKESLERNMAFSIDKEIYIYLFDIKEDDNKLIVKDKLKKFYTGEDVKRYYYGKDVERQKTMNKLIELLKNITEESNDIHELRKLLNENKEKILKLQNRFKDLKAFFRNGDIVVKMDEQETVIELDFNK